MKYRPVTLLGGEYEQQTNEHYVVPTLLAKVALTGRDDKAEILQSSFMTSAPTQPNTLLAIHGSHVISDPNGIEAYQTTHHVVGIPGNGESEETYAIYSEDSTDTLYLSDKVGLMAMRVLLIADRHEIGRRPSTPLPPFIPQQKRPE